jgi:hypothetical protein
MRAKLAILASVILCVNASAQPTKYAVEGLALGMQLNLDDASYGEYTCGPSEQFDRLTWCLKTRRDGAPRGSTATYSLLHSRDGSVFYISRAQEPGVFNAKQAQDEIEQYSHALGESPQLIKMPRRNGLAYGLIAVWGNVTLEQLDHDSIKTLADRKDLKKGLLIDFLGNFARSAKASLPIYRIDGGPGLVWAASFDQKGRGIVRLAAVDTSRFVTPSAAQQPVGQLPGITSEASEPPQRELSLTTEKVETEPNAATAIADPEKAKAAPEGDQSEATTDERANLDVVPRPVATARAAPEVSSPSAAPQAEVSLTTEKVQTEPNAATAIADGEKTKAAELHQSEAKTDEKANAGGVPARVEATSAMPEVSSSSWETVPYEAIVGLLLVVLTACTVVVCMRHKTRISKEQALQPRNPTQAPAQPLIGPSLSPDAAFIEEIRRSSRRANESVLRALASCRSGSAQLVSGAIQRSEK